MNVLNHSRKPAARTRSGSLLALFLLTALLALVTPLRAANPPSYLFQWGSLGADNAQFNGPYGIAVDYSNNVYVVDSVNSRIEKFDRSGTYLIQWGTSGTGNGQFTGPASIAVDRSNNVYVADTSNERIEKFDGSGHYLTHWGSAGANNAQFDYPAGVAVDSSNDVYVTDYYNSRIEKFSGNGDYLTQWGSYGTNHGQFVYAGGIAIDSSNDVYVVDAQNFRIEKFDSNGNCLTQWGNNGSGNGQFVELQGIAIDGSDNVCVADGYTQRVQKFASNDNYLTQWGSAGSDAGQFEGAYGIAVDSAANLIYMADNGNDRVEVFVNDPNIVAPIVTNQPAGQTVPAGAKVTFGVRVVGAAPFAYQWSSNDVPLTGATNTTFTLTDVVFADSASYSVLVTNSYGSELSSNAALTVLPVAEFVAPSYLFQIDSSAVPGEFQPNGVTLDSNDSIYITDGLNNRILKFASNGNYLTQWGSAGNGAGQFEGPYGIAVDTGYSVYVTDASNERVEKFDDQGNYLTQWGSLGTGNRQFNFPQGIAVDSSKDVYVVDAGNSRIEKFNGSIGAYLTKWDSADSGSFIAADSNNNVYVTVDGNDCVEKFDSNGNYLTKWGGLGNGPGQFGGPCGIAVDSSNNIYVTDIFNQRVQKFDSNGHYLTQWGGVGSGSGQFGNPFGIAVDSTGNFIYVADSGNDRIEVFVNNPNIVAPIITNQPASQTVPAAASVTFGVGVAGTAPFAYQWYSNNVPLTGATNATFTLTDVSFADSASYSTMVTNIFGGVLSGNAVLTVVPTLVTRLPATGISATNATLNGTVTVGSDDTSVWFNWGTDTSYGNSAGTTVVPGGSGSNDLSVALNGLPGNVYHYRLVASNALGIVNGKDESFTLGFAPTVATPYSVNAANGTTLNVSVNPQGWDTKVYFKWGLGNIRTNTTPLMNAGAGAASLNISSVITGLTDSSSYTYQAFASNSLGTASSAVVTFLSFPFANVPNENWDSVASSADGSVLAAVANVAGGASPAGPILISTNSGAGWSIATGAPTNGLWETVACSADGSKMIAAGGGGDSHIFPIYTSSDMGATWVSNKAPVLNWQSVASSADGARLVAAAELNQVIYTSTNSGAIWTQATNAPKVSWFSVALSADGTKLAAVANGSTNIYTSPDFGATWVTNNVPVGPQGIIQRGWSSIASSADGSKLIATVGGNGASGFIFISTNYGTAWKVTATNMPSGLVSHPWIYVASSADGSKLAAVSDGGISLGVVVTSTNSGATWTTNAVPFLLWNAVALSADGSKLVASVGYPSTGPIYVSQTTPAPVLDLSASDNVVSWVIPSLDFTLQQSSDLLTWTDVTNVPVFNFTNLENQVALPATLENNFFRLKH